MIFNKYNEADAADSMFICMHIRLQLRGCSDHPENFSFQNFRNLRKLDRLGRCLACCQDDSACLDLSFDTGLLRRCPPPADPPAHPAVQCESSKSGVTSYFEVATVLHKFMDPDIDSIRSAPSFRSLSKTEKAGGNADDEHEAIVINRYRNHTARNISGSQ
jgi:hypothetical protein